MCLIVDVNIATNVLLDNGHADFASIRKALLERKALLVAGGQLRREYARVNVLRKLLMVMDQGGRAKLFSDSQVDTMEKNVKDGGLCKSNDQHIIALAIVSNARILCSGDTDLHEDFKNKTILNPKGNVYKNNDHKDLLRKHCV